MLRDGLFRGLRAVWRRRNAIRDTAQASAKADLWLSDDAVGCRQGHGCGKGTNAALGGDVWHGVDFQMEEIYPATFVKKPDYDLQNSLTTLTVFIGCKTLQQNFSTAFNNISPSLGAGGFVQ
ncbi:hypothetical protein B0T49_12825 [Chromobacterium violaceum]|nr:hypothetical protein B0T48_10405 [Chromobacterium violaceum]OQS49708.1 hypothetical protein B0T49_12825 [Chromobacterium violaceum]